MREIVKLIRQLNRAFNHNAEVAFVNTETKEINVKHAPTLKKNPIAPDLIGKWMEGNYGFVHPDHPNILFFAVNKLEAHDIFACCDQDIFTCAVCGMEHEVTPESLARHEFVHSLQLRLNPRISHGLAEDIADDLEFIDIVKIADITGII